MSKKGTYNAGFFNGFAVRLHGTPIRFGALVGTRPEECLRDVVFASPTPPQPAAEEGAAPPEAVKDILAHLKSKAGPAFAAWAGQHALALRRLLPAGLEPCGCFAVVSESAARDLAPLLTPVLKGIDDPLVLTIDPSSKKLFFWQHSGGAKAALRPAQVKADNHKDALLVWAAVPLDVAVLRSWGDEAAAAPSGDGDDGEDAAAAAAAAAAESATKAVERGVDAALSQCTCGVAAEPTEDAEEDAEEDAKGGCASAAAAPMRVVSDKSELTVGAVAGKGVGELRVSFLHSGTGLAVPEAVPKGAGRCLRQRCLVVATAFVLRRDTELRRVVEALRKSLAVSAADRLQLAHEEAEEAGGLACKGRLQLPWRALFCPQEFNLPVWCGDYCMPDEEASAAQERLAQLLGIHESALGAAPRKLDEHARLSREHKGTYDSAAADDGAAVGGAASSASAAGMAKGSSAISAVACAAAVVAAVVALLVPLALRN